jgi:hypothetical protein
MEQTRQATKPYNWKSESLKKKNGSFNEQVFFSFIPFGIPFLMTVCKQGDKIASPATAGSHKGQIYFFNSKYSVQVMVLYGFLLKTS